MLRTKPIFVVFALRVSIGAKVTRAARFSQADLTRALKSFEKAGVQVAGAKINPDGTITVLTGEPVAANDRWNPMDRVLQ